MSQIPLQKRLAIKKYNAEDCVLALRGERIPQALGLAVTRLCVVRGIRYHAGFGAELHGSTEDFTRALNARSIMDNVIPKMNQPADFPYCIWHPQTATEHTYRQLVIQYPQMAYQVGRACAVAGYTELYSELGLLPEVHIAEEAFENGNSAIYDAIMKPAIVKYEVMNDYTCSINVDTPRANACLNGDTAVKSWLDNSKQRFTKPSGTHPGFRPLYFNITGDMNIDEHDSDPWPGPRPEVPPLLYTPLPADLPTIHKDLLILVAAYHGDVDRYTRLRRPALVHGELNCIVRGIYHNVMFAKWWSLQSLDSLNLGQRAASHIEAAITARFIMSNDLSRIKDVNLTTMPYLIWYPALALESTYRELARQKPNMMSQVARSCIVANYQKLYDALNPEPDIFLLCEARDSINPHYRQDLESKMLERGMSLDATMAMPGWKKYTRKDLFERSTAALQKEIGVSDVISNFEFIYNGLDASISGIELFLCVPEEVGASIEFDSSGSFDLFKLYENLED